MREWGKESGRYFQRHFRYHKFTTSSDFSLEIFLQLLSEVAMEVISRRSPSSSTLNPNAPLFVPLAYRTVEDFSDQWWALVQSSPWFRDYWLQECFEDPETDPHFYDIDDPVLPDIDALFDDGTESKAEEQKEHQRELVSLGALKWRKTRDPVVMPRYFEKAPKIVSVKVSPRPIQQPR